MAMISLRGYSYKQYNNSEGEPMERVYETVFDIDVDCIESMCPSTGPLSAPDDLPYSRIVGKSGRFYDIKLSLDELRKEVSRAKREAKLSQLLVQSQ